MCTRYAAAKGVVFTVFLFNKSMHQCLSMLKYSFVVWKPVDKKSILPFKLTLASCLSQNDNIPTIILIEDDLGQYDVAARVSVQRITTLAQRRLFRQIRTSEQPYSVGTYHISLSNGMVIPRFRPTNNPPKLCTKSTA